MIPTIYGITKNQSYFSENIYGFSGSLFVLLMLSILASYTIGPILLWLDQPKIIIMLENWTSFQVKKLYDTNENKRQ